MELRSDDRLGRIGAQARRRYVEQHRKVDVLDARLDGIAEADVDGDRNARTGERLLGVERCIGQLIEAARPPRLAPCD
jgi:hypothetical protein